MLWLLGRIGPPSLGRRIASEILRIAAIGALTAGHRPYLRLLIVPGSAIRTWRCRGGHHSDALPAPLLLQCHNGRALMHRHQLLHLTVYLVSWHSASG